MPIYDDNSSAAFSVYVRELFRDWSKPKIDAAGGPSASQQGLVEGGRTEVTARTMSEYATALINLLPGDSGHRAGAELRAVHQLLSQPATSSGPAIDLDSSRLRFASAASAVGPADHLDVTTLLVPNIPTSAHRLRWFQTAAGIADAAAVTFVDRTALNDWSDVLPRPQAQLRDGSGDIGKTLALDPLVALRGIPVNYTRRIVDILAGTTNPSTNPWPPLLLSALLDRDDADLADLYNDEATASLIMVSGQGFSMTADEFDQARTHLRRLFAPLRASVIDALSGTVEDLRLMPTSSVTEFEDLYRRSPVAYWPEDLPTVSMLGAILAHASSEDHASAQSVAFGAEGRITAIHPLFDDPRARVGELRILPELEAIGILTLTHIPDQPYAVRFA